MLRPNTEVSPCHLMVTFVASILTVDRKSTWFTGVQLIAVYIVMAITVLAIPASRAAGRASG